MCWSENYVCKQTSRSIDKKLAHRNWVFATDSIFLIPISLQPGGVHLLYFQLESFDRTGEGGGKILTVNSKHLASWVSGISIKYFKVHIDSHFLAWTILNLSFKQNCCCIATCLCLYYVPRCCCIITTCVCIMSQAAAVILLPVSVLCPKLLLYCYHSRIFHW